MPKIKKTPSNLRQSPFPVARSSQSVSAEPQPGHRNTVNWSSADDEVLAAARAAGLNWQSTAAKHFPNKTANACRKRHERMVERRTHEDWTTKRLDTLAVQYMELRKEIWGPLAAKVGERWNVVEAKASRKRKPHVNKGFSNELASAWRRGSEISSRLHVPLARHPLLVMIVMLQTRKSTRAIPASAGRTLKRSQSILLPLLVNLRRVQHRSACCNPMNFRLTNKTHCIISCPGFRHCPGIMLPYRRLLSPSQVFPLDRLAAMLQSESEHQITRLGGVSVSNLCFRIHRNLEHPDGQEL
jgi:hypothetical protein